MRTLLHNIFGLVAIVLLKTILKLFLFGSNFFFEFLPELLFLLDSAIVLLRILLLFGIKLLLQCLDGLIISPRAHNILRTFLLFEPLNFGPQGVKIRLHNQHFI